MLRLTSLGLGFTASVLVARHLGPTGYGEVAFVLAVLTLLSIPSNNALSPLIVREVAKGKDDDAAAWDNLHNLMAWSLKVLALMVLLAGGIICLWVLWLIGTADAAQVPLLLVGVPIVLLWAMSARIAGILQGLNRVVMAQLFDWLVVPLTYLCLIIVFWINGNLTPLTVLSSTALSLFMGAVLGGVTLRRFEPRLKFLFMTSRAQGSPQWLKAWKNFSLISVVSIANVKISVLLLGVLALESQVGFYRVAENLATLLSMVLVVANSVIAPRVANLFAQRNLADLQRLTKNAARLALLLMLPIALLLLLLPHMVVSRIFGDQYMGAVPVLMVLVAGQLVNVATGAVAMILNMTGNESATKNSFIVSLLLNLVLGLVLIPAYGALGAALAATAGTIIWNVLLLIRTRQTVRINPSVF